MVVSRRLSIILGSLIVKFDCESPPTEICWNHCWSVFTIFLYVCHYPQHEITSDIQVKGPCSTMIELSLEIQNSWLPGEVQWQTKHGRSRGGIALEIGSHMANFDLY